MKNKKLIIKIIAMISITFLIIIFGLTINQKQARKYKPTAVVVVGLPKNKEDGLQKELTEAFKYKSYLDRGNELVKQGRTEDAIKEYKIAFSIARISGAKAVAILAMADAYEKNRNYEKALELVIIDRDKYVNEWAKEPVIERAIYLDYALKGEYELAVEHAKKALEEDTKLPNVPKGGSPDYIQRLNDLRAAKDYILSLKKIK